MINKNISSKVCALIDAHGIDWMRPIWRREVWQEIHEEVFVLTPIGCYYLNPDNNTIIRLGTPITQIKKLSFNWYNWGDYVFKAQVDVSGVYEEVDIENNTLFAYKKGQEFADDGTECALTSIFTCNTKIGDYQAPTRQLKYDYNKD